jgi:hypothetical protein
MVTKYTLVAFNESKFSAQKAFQDCEGIHILDFNLDMERLTPNFLNEVSYGTDGSELSKALYATTQTARLLDSNTRMGFYLMQEKGTVPEGTPPIAFNTYATWQMFK